MQFVDEDDDLTLAVDDLLEHGLQPLLELAAELGTSDQRAEIEGEQLLASQPFRYVTVDDALCQALHDRGLADTRFTDQHRIVLGAT